MPTPRAISRTWGGRLALPERGSKLPSHRLRRWSGSRIKVVDGRLTAAEWSPARGGRDTRRIRGYVAHRRIADAAGRGLDASVGRRTRPQGSPWEGADLARKPSFLRSRNTLYRPSDYTLSDRPPSDPKGTSAAIVDTTCALTADSWTRAGPTGVQSRTPSWANARRTSATSLLCRIGKGVDCTLET